MLPSDRLASVCQMSRNLAIGILYGTQIITSTYTQIESNVTLLTAATEVNIKVSLLCNTINIIKFTTKHLMYISFLYFLWLLQLLNGKYSEQTLKFDVPKYHVKYLRKDSLQKRIMGNRNGKYGVKLLM